MRISDLARAVDVAPAELAERIFVTRQALDYEPKKMTATMELAVHALHAINQERKNKGIQEAEELCRARDKILDDFVSRYIEEVW